MEKVEKRGEGEGRPARDCGGGERAFVHPNLCCCCSNFLSQTAAMPQPTCGLILYPLDPRFYTRTLPYWKGEPDGC